MAHGWSMRAAGQVAELAKQIAAGKQLRYKRDELRSDILDVWQQRVPDGDSPKPPASRRRTLNTSREW
jgi:hypothetical protein